MNKTITIVINEQGDTSIDLAGYGQGCAATLKDFADGSGKLLKETTKREYYGQQRPALQKQGGSQ